MPGKLFYGWVIVAASFVVLAVVYSLQFSYGVFLPFLTEDLGLDRATATAPLSLYILVYSLMSFVAGPLSDRLGPRTVVLTGGLLLGLAYLLLSTVTSGWQLFAFLGLIAGAGMSAAFIPLNATVVRWFVKRRGLALAITGTGMNVAVLIGPVSAAALIPALGWRTSFLVLGLTAGSVILLCALTLVRDPEARNLRPDGADTDRSTAPGVGSADISLTPAQARLTAAFWIILGIFFLTWTIVFFPYVHLPALATDLGHDPAVGASLLGVMAFGGFAGRVVIGWVSDVVGRLQGLHAALGVQVIACLMFALADSLLPLYLAAILFSAGVSAAITLFPAIIGDAFGRLHVGAISGTLFAAAGTAAAFGPYMAGLIRDATGTYQAAFLIGAGCNVAAIVLATQLRSSRGQG